MGAAEVGPGPSAPATLLRVPGLADLDIQDSGAGVELLVHNPGAAALTVARDGDAELTIAPSEHAVIPLQATPDGDRLHLQFLSAAHQRVATALVTLEVSPQAAIAVGQAIGADAR